MRTNGRDIRFTEPLYTVAEASRFLGVPSTTVARWAKGYLVRHPERPTTVAGPVITGFEAARDYPSIPFVGLAEGLVVAAFRRAGVSLQHIRAAVAVLQREIRLDHALASRRLYADGARVLFDYVEREGDEELTNLTVVVSQQRVFVPIVREYLECITYGDDDWPTLLFSPVTRVVAADPKRSFGQPIFSHGAAPVEAVVDRWEAGESIAELLRGLLRPGAGYRGRPPCSAPRRRLSFSPTEDSGGMWSQMPSAPPARWSARLPTSTATTRRRDPWGRSGYPTSATTRSSICCSILGTRSTICSCCSQRSL